MSLGEMCVGASSKVHSDGQTLSALLQIGKIGDVPSIAFGLRIMLGCGGWGPALLDQDWHVMRVCRLYPQVILPLFDEEGAKAVAWVERHVSEYGGDPNRIVLTGHSAGGIPRRFLAFNHEFLRKFCADPNRIAGLVGLSGTCVFVPDSGGHERF
jgi:hypothetical protein